MLLSLTACGKVPFPGKVNQEVSITGNMEKSVDVAPSADKSISSDEDTTDEKNDQPNVDTATDDDSWKAEFEKSLLESYGVKPDHYEELDKGVYQVYVDIDGETVHYVEVDFATGDYHG